MTFLKTPKLQANQAADNCAKWLRLELLPLRVDGFYVDSKMLCLTESFECRARSLNLHWLTAVLLALSLCCTRATWTGMPDTLTIHNSPH